MKRLSNVFRNKELLQATSRGHGSGAIHPIAGMTLFPDLVFVPDLINVDDIKTELIKIFFNIRKKRPILDMHDNEDMVKRTVAEFCSAYDTLVKIFEDELASGNSTALMRFMFTRFATKIIGFRRRIMSLLGYTGGESLEQISISEEIKRLAIQPYSLWNFKGGKPTIWGDENIIK